MADRPTQEWLKPEKASGTAAKTGHTSLPLPNDNTLTLQQSRSGSKAGESADYQVAGGFYKTNQNGGPAGPSAQALIGARSPQNAMNLDTEQSGGVFIVKPLSGARRQIVDPDNTKTNDYPGGF